MRLSSIVIWIIALSLLVFLYYQGSFEFVMNSFGRNATQYNAPSDETRYAITFLLQTASNNPGNTVSKKGVAFKEKEVYDRTLMAGVGPGTLAIECVECSGSGSDTVLITRSFMTGVSACCDGENNCKLGIGVNISC